MKTKFSPVMRLSFIIVLLFSSLAAIPFSQSEKSQNTSTRDFLADLGGVSCFDESVFTCVTIDMPLDPFNPDDTRTIQVTFAVLPASGARKGYWLLQHK